MDGLRVTPGLEIPADELRWRFSASGGPGGQHANTANTRAEVRFDIAGSPTLRPEDRRRLLAAFGPEVRVSAADERSQARNRSSALDRLRARMAEALAVEPTRTPTRPGAGARRRRLEHKRRRAQLKQQRGRRYSPED